MPPKLTRIHECQSASRLSAASDVMSIRRTDKHCGARLVAAPASLLLVLYPLLPLSVSLSLPSASKPAVCRHLQPSTLLSFPLSASRTAFSPFLRFSHLFLCAFYIYIYLLPPALVAFALELDKGRERACVLWQGTDEQSRYPAISPTTTVDDRLLVWLTDWLTRLDFL